MTVLSALRLTFLTSLIHRFPNTRLNSAMSIFENKHQLVIDPFAIRQFNNPDYTGTQVTYDTSEFESKVNENYAAGMKLVDGYAPFW